MTLRLVLIVLVAALGLTVPQWPDSQERAGTANTQTVRAVKTRGPRPSFQFGWGGSIKNRAASVSIASVGKQGQPIGADSRVVRPTTGATSNFWRVPSGVHAVDPASTASVIDQASKPMNVSFEPILVAANADEGLAMRLNRMSEGLGFEIQGPPARLRAPLSGPRALAFGTGLDDGIARYLRNSTHLWPLRTDRAEPQITTAKVVVPSFFRVLRPFYSGLASMVRDLRSRVEESARMAETLSVSISSAIRARLESKPAVVAVQSPSRSLDVALPEDVFAEASASLAPAVVAQAVALPENLFVEAPASPAPAAVVAQTDRLPEDVFASVPDTPVSLAVVKVAEEVSGLPEDVFAPVVTREIGTAETAVTEKEVPTGTASGMTLGTEKPAQSPKIDSPGQLTNAVSLTRDAAVAWMKVFSGSAVVTLHR